MHPYTLILASASPRRKELLSWTNIPFRIQVSAVEEISSFTQPKDIVEDLAKQKGKAVYQQLSQDPAYAKDFFPLVVGADTLVALDGHLLGKPKNDDGARVMLQQLSGKTHQVLTGIYIGFLEQNPCEAFSRYREIVFSCMTEVEFAPISPDLLDPYILSGDPLDKAGSYGIQGPALAFIKGIRGSYSNVVGFPLCEFLQQLKRALGLKENDPTGEWRKRFL